MRIYKLSNLQCDLIYKLSNLQCDLIYGSEIVL
jgi:hypothetical protein